MYLVVAHTTAVTHEPLVIVPVYFPELLPTLFEVKIPGPIVDFRSCACV